MKKEELILFPAIRRGGMPGIENPIAVMRADHAGHDREVAEIRRLTGNLSLPDGACGTWTAALPGSGRVHRRPDRAYAAGKRRAVPAVRTRWAGRCLRRRTLASSPCLAGEIAPDGFDPLAVDPEQARDVARWRRAERIRLRAARDALSVADRQAAGVALSAHLRHLLAEQFSGAAGLILSAYWPIKGEPDLRDLMADLHGRGVTLALPVVEVKAAPLVFRRWMPGMADGAGRLEHSRAAARCRND